jgi:hypothetical protein
MVLQWLITKGWNPNIGLTNLRSLLYLLREYHGQ